MIIRKIKVNEEASVITETSVIPETVFKCRRSLWKVFSQIYLNNDELTRGFKKTTLNTIEINFCFGICSQARIFSHINNKGRRMFKKCYYPSIIFKRTRESLNLPQTSFFPCNICRNSDNRETKCDKFWLIWKEKGLASYLILSVSLIIFPHSQKLHLFLLGRSINENTFFWVITT